jgi:hypothetical protein
MKSRSMFASLGAVVLVVTSSSAMAQVGASASGQDVNQQMQQEALARDAAHKQELINTVLSARETASARAFTAELRRSLTDKLSMASTSSLEAFAEAGGLGNIDALVTNTLGDSAADLAFTPVAPCRIIDTRSSAAGLLVSGVDQSFFVRNAGGFAVQGGSATDCGIPATATSVEMNFVSVGPSGPGDLRVFAFGGVLPTASVLNYTNLPSLNIANGIAQPVCNPATATCTKDITVHADVSNTHLVVDVVGYFKKIDGSVLTRAISAEPFVNATTTPVTNTLIAGVVAPTAGGFLVNITFSCASFTGTTNTRWDITPKVDAISHNNMVLFFPHAAVATQVGATASATFFQGGMAAGTHAISYTASRSNGDGSLDCNIFASSHFVPFNNAGGTP